MSNESRKKIKNSFEPESEINSKHPDQSRRRFAKAGVIAPVMLTLANRPAWGDTGRCFVSGFGSATEGGSGVVGNKLSCNYLSPTEVVNNLSNNDKNAQLSTIFSCVPSHTPPYKVSDALNGDAGVFTQLMTAALFNADPTTELTTVFPAFVPKNPLGSNSIDHVHCHFISGGGPYNVGNVFLDQADIETFLTAMLLP